MYLVYIEYGLLKAFREPQKSMPIVGYTNDNQHGTHISPFNPNNKHQLMKAQTNRDAFWDMCQYGYTDEAAQMISYLFKWTADNLLGFTNQN